MGRLPRPTGDDLIYHERTIRCQFIIIASFGRTIRCQFIMRTIRCQFIMEDNSVSVHHYCFLCIKSVSWIHGRLPRPTGDDLIYHAINRGNNRADVLGPDGERDMFLGDLACIKARYPFALFGYCLMSNHFHLLLGGQFREDNSVSVHHYCFLCIKSVSWIHGKTSKTDRR